MICPKCGKTIEDNALYCEHCGEEIKIVPEFEIDINFAADILAREVMLSKEEEKQNLLKEQLKQKRKHILFLGTALVVVVVIIGILVGCFIYSGSYKYQMIKANAAIEKENYTKAILYLEKAYSLRLDDMSLLMDLGESYYRANQMDDFVETMELIISNVHSTDKHLIKAYSKLIAFYDLKQDYVSIETLLSKCDVEDVISLYDRFIASEPIFSYPEGTYESMLPLKLSSNTTGEIYYAMNGKIPMMADEYLYTSPLYLEAGTHTISAFFVNQYGMKSDTVTYNYRVKPAAPSAPEISIDDGEYYEPTFIEVLKFDDVTIYYTTDGTFPTQNSMIYSEPIPMPLGKTTFRFVGYNANGVAGEITEKTYHLILDTTYTTDTACYDIIKLMIENGKISDTIGTSANANGWYKYQFLYPISVEGYGEFYVIAESFQDMAGNRERTGILYGVNIYDRTIYQLSKGKNGNYLLEGF